MEFVVSPHCIVCLSGRTYVMDSVTGKELPEEEQKAIFDRIRAQAEADDKSGKWKCPKCKSDDVWIGAFVLSCNACGWHYLNAHPCDVCGKPSFSSCGSGNMGEYKSYHGCKDHPATDDILDTLRNNEAK